MHTERTSDRSASAASSRRRVYFMPIVALALLLRLVLAMAMAQGNPDLWFYNQASELGCLAHSVNAGHGLASPFCGVTGPSAFLAPGYPLLVALVFHLFGEFSMRATETLVALQILFGLLTIVASMLLTRRLFGAQAANVAGAFCAVSPTMFWLPVLFWETSLSILLLTTSLVLALRCVDKSRPMRWAAMGLLCALSTLVNPALALTLLAVMAWAGWQNYRCKASFTGPLLAVIFWAVAFAAWPVRNLVAMHAFIPLRSNLGYELWQGNYAGSDGEFNPRLHLNVNRVERARYIQIGEVAYMREKAGLAVAAIKADPARFARLSFERCAKFWIGYTAKKKSFIIISSVSLTSLLALSGLLLLARRRASDAILLALPFLLFPLPYYLTHADFRFRLVLDPIAIMLSTYVLQCWRAHVSANSVGDVLSATTITA